MKAFEQSVLQAIARFKQWLMPVDAQLSDWENRLDTMLSDTAVAPYYTQLKAWLLLVPASLWLIILLAGALVLTVWWLIRESRYAVVETKVDRSAVVAPTTPMVDETMVAGWMSHSNVVSTPTVGTESGDWIPGMSVAVQVSQPLIAAATVDGWTNTKINQAEAVAIALQKSPVETEKMATPFKPMFGNDAIQAWYLPSMDMKTPPTATISNETVRAWYTSAIEQAAASNTPNDAAEYSKQRFSQLLKGLSAEQLDLRQSTVSMDDVDNADNRIQPITVDVATEQNDGAMTEFGTTAASVEAPITPPIGAVNPPVQAQNVPHLDVNQQLKRYAERERQREKSREQNIPVPYDKLNERVRLQKWMTAFSPEQLLAHAQTAHGQGEERVAQHILNEVLLRGNGAQSTTALDWRIRWIKPDDLTAAAATPIAATASETTGVPL